MPPELSHDDQSTAASTGSGTVQTLDRAASPEAGTILGQFRIEARIGQGGLGSVFRAYDVKLARPVALKVLHEASSTDAARRLLAEARAAASLTHPSIAAIHDVQQQQGVAFIVMELVPGDSLRAEVRRGPIPADTVVGYLVDIAAGLARAHAAGIVHRDLKPENVMITPEGHARILDFGLAREAPDGPPPSSKAGGASAVGTPSYMAPEQARGDRVDARADIFAFGVVAYEMLTGKRPFASSRSRGGDGRDWRIVSPLVDAAPRAPGALVAVIDRCLAIHRGDRFADGGELLGALRTLERAKPASRLRLVAFLAPAAILAAIASPFLREALHAKAVPNAPRAEASAPIVADDPRVAPLREDLGRARAAWRAGDTVKAKRMLEAIVSTVDHAAIHAPSPLARVAGEADLLLGSIEETAVVGSLSQALAKDPDFGPHRLELVQVASGRAAAAYGKVPMWAVLDLSMCSTYRTGRTYEKVYGLARTTFSADLAAHASEVERAYPGGIDVAKSSWGPTFRNLRESAIANYDAAIATARYVDGPAKDPEDGTDCGAAAMTRRDALKALGDAGL